MINTPKLYVSHQLILFFHRNRYIQNGLTIPFIIGANRLITGMNLTIPQMIFQFTEEGASDKMTIMKCNNIGEFVIGIMDSFTESYYKKFPLNRVKAFGDLIVTDDSLDNFRSIGEIACFFEEVYLQITNLGKYSKHEGVWTDFTLTDIKRIEQFKDGLLGKY